MKDTHETETEKIDVVGLTNPRRKVTNPYSCNLALEIKEESNKSLQLLSSS